jgi:hypothetical protein
MLLLCVLSLLLFWRGSTTPQCPVTHFSNPDGRSAVHFMISSPMVFPKISCWMSFHFQDIAILLSHSSLCRCCIPFCTTSLPKCSSFPGSLYNIVPGLPFPSPLFNLRSFMTASHTPCHSCPADHPSAGGNQLCLAPTITLGPFLWL